MVDQLLQNPLSRDLTGGRAERNKTLYSAQHSILRALQTVWTVLAGECVVCVCRSGLAGLQVLQQVDAKYTEIYVGPINDKI